MSVRRLAFSGTIFPGFRSRPDLLFRFLTLLLLRCTAPLTIRRFGRRRRSVGNATAVALTFFWKNLLAFCLAELHLIPVLRRFSYNATECCALKLPLRNLISFV